MTKTLYFLTISLFCFNLNGCFAHSNNGHQASGDNAKPSSSLSSNQQPTNQLQEVLPNKKKRDEAVNDIRQVDFKNYTYPTTPELKKLSNLDNFSIRDGDFSYQWGNKDSRLEIFHVKTSYAQILGKRSPVVAINVFSVFYGDYGIIGSGRTHCLFVHSIVNGELVVLWSMDTGDRSNGGLRRVYEKNKNLIVEVYGKRVQDRESLSTPACCTKVYTRKIYSWNESRFQLIKELLLDNPSEDTSFIPE